MGRNSPCLLTIAGSDPSGGAGIQADIKTMTVLGCYAGAVITAITCQNSLGVTEVVPVDSRLVYDQIQAVLTDLPVSHVKIGMTASTAVCAAIATALADFDGEIILDPVLAASSGHSLQAGGAVDLTPLLKLCTVLTPNRSELEEISGQDISNRRNARLAGERLFSASPSLTALCLKGGHFDEEQEQVKDTLLLRRNDTIHTYYQRHSRIQTNNSHGTGCTFASAFAALHARTGSFEQAFNQTARFMDALLKASCQGLPCQGTGPLLHHQV